MKTANRLFGILLGATVLFVSCTKQENPVRQDGNTFEMTIVAGSDQTRTVLGSDGTVTWSATGEQLAVIEQSYVGETPSVSKATSNEGYTTDEGVTMYFGVSLTAKTADSYNYYSVYPNSAYVSSSNTNVEKFKVELVSTQTPTATSFGPEADILVSKAVIGETAQPAELKLQFARVIAVGKMTIKNLNTTEKVKKVTFTAAGKPVTGRSYINLTTAAGVEYGYSNQGVDNVVLDYSDKTITANGMTAVFTCWPFTLAANETFSVVVETENYTFTKDVTLAEGKSLAFNVGRASAFNVSFTGIEGIEKEPATQLVEDGAYVVAYGENIMTVGTASNSYRGVATLPQTANEDGSYTVDATAAWNFVYDSATDTYKIYSASDNTLYLSKGSSNTALDLNAKSATSFTITKDEVDGSVRIIYDTRCIGYNYNNGSPRFAMYLTNTDQIVDLNLYPAKFAIIPKIDVQETLSVPSAETTSSFPVTLTNVETAEVNVYKNEDCTIKETEWITANLNTESTAVEYYALENTTNEARTAYIKIYALGPDANEATAIVTVTQAKAVALTAYPYSESFAESQGNFTIDNVSLPSELTYVWQHSTYNNEGYMKASAFKSSKNYAAESWLISPVVDMSSAVNPVLSFMTVARFGSNENLTLWAREKGGNWAQLSFSNYGTGNDWNFVSNTVDLSAYAGKTLQFAYKYVSTDTGASTWEIKNVEVKEQGAAATLSSIAWTGYTTTYNVGDVFKADGTVTATYSDGSTKDVTSEASFSTPDMSTAGAKTVTITYEGETTTGEITVKDSGSTGGEASWIRVTTVDDLIAGGTFIIGYEATANSGVIVPMANKGSATTSAAGFIYSGLTATSGGTDTIDMSAVSETSNYEVTIVPSTSVSGAICIKLGANYLGNTNTKNNCKLFAEEAATTAFTPTVGANNVFTLKIAANKTYHTLQYNTGSPRFAVYGGAQQNVVIYKKAN